MAKRQYQRPVKELMTRNPIVLPEDATLRDASRRMRDADIGDILVVDGRGELCGILTDRDIVVRCIADNRDPDATTCGDVCTRQVIKVSPNDDVSQAIRKMRDSKIRRLPVTDNGVAQGILSIGDLAGTLDPNSVLGEISEASPQR